MPFNHGICTFVHLNIIAVIFTADKSGPYNYAPNTIIDNNCSVINFFNIVYFQAITTSVLSKFSSQLVDIETKDEPERIQIAGGMLYVQCLVSLMTMTITNALLKLCFSFEQEHIPYLFDYSPGLV